MKLYTLHFHQNIPISKKEAWSFFSNPANLKIITPGFMGFDIISGGESPMYPGQIIQYHVKPIAGLKVKWVTEITHVLPEDYFVDEQRFGPYAFWHHKHFLKEIPGGVEMQDIIDYKLPFGIFGQIAHPILVKPKLREIFKYRQKKLKELFGDFPPEKKARTSASKR